MQLLTQTTSKFRSMRSSRALPDHGHGLNVTRQLLKQVRLLGELILAALAKLRVRSDS